MGPAIPLYEPTGSGSEDNIFMSKSYDATSHFETTTGELPATQSQRKNANHNR
jgi:Rab GDP dissociation inhibitor